MDNIIKFLIERRGEWKCRPGTDIPTSFNQGIMFPKAKMWIQFLCTHIAPTLNVSNTHLEQEEEEHESEAEEGVEEGEEDDEMDFEEDD
ncbi:hypothetical protein J1N35_037460 [Gossypium stocksii]|uniref:Uncharacterized protein n=1 Tax=Gossypium stocksii TaxID=47602 RepID=A0A9D3UK74_9ROSI|nr:hypothetical protein J1N35_037460 [Gossypium stocksii]